MENLQINLEVSLEDIVDGIVFLDYNKILKFVKDIDLRVADVGFTENLIILLVRSFKNDLNDLEKEMLLEVLKREIK